MINRYDLKKYLQIEVEEDYLFMVEDIRMIEEKTIFVVRKGTNYDNFKNIEYALSKNCLIIHENINENRGYYIKDLDVKINLLLENVYKDLFYNFHIVGVVGSNGKSSVVSYLYDLCEYEAMKIGTHFIESKYFSYPNENTTPSLIQLVYAFFKAFKKSITHIFMEVSSHSISENRLSFIRFDYLIYTNINRDHIDYHKTLFHYRYTKYKAMKYLKNSGIVIVNRDELYYEEIKKLCKHPLITYGKNTSHFEIKDVSLSKEGSIFYVNQFFYRTSLLSMMNVYNLTCCIAYLKMCNKSYYDIYKKILTLTTLEGRLEVVYNKDFCVIVDYAHTAKAFYETISFLSQIKKNRLLCVVGCGGDREREKRAEIGYFASYYSDLVIFTEDNTRKEKIEDIISDMVKRCKENYKIVYDRKKAIETSITMALNNDIILVSGKGNETFLLRNKEKIPFNDKKLIKEILE